MLTFRVGAAGSPSGGTAMAQHLLSQTLPTDKADLAAYYARTALPAFAGQAAVDAFAEEAARLVREGASPDLDEASAALRGAVLDRHEAFVADYLGGMARGVSRADAYARLAEYATASDDPGAEMARMEAVLTGGMDHRVGELRHMLAQAEAHGLLDKIDDVPVWRQQLARMEALREQVITALWKAQAEAEYRFDKAMENVGAGREGRTIAEPRRDMHPALAARLGLDPHRAPTEKEIGHLLNGLRADGEPIEGKAVRASTASLATALGLDADRQPTREEMAHILAGKRTDGGKIEGEGTKTATSRFFHLYGVKADRPTPEQAAHIVEGRRADGSEMPAAAYKQGVTAARARVGYIDLTFSADKSLSVAWAFAPTHAERAILHQAHRDAVDTVLRQIARELGHVRRGDGGKGGTEPGHVAWVTFDHYTARPTAEIARTDAQGRGWTELATVKAAGDMQIHTHAALIAAVLTDKGHVGGIDLAQMENKIHEWGALYQAYLAANLRRHGVDVALDKETGAARLTAVAPSARAEFSKRTRDGTEAAREFARDLGLDWDTLSPERRSGLLKSGTQGHKLAKAAGMTTEARAEYEGAARKDDVGDFETWERRAREIGYVHRSVLRPDEVRAPPSRDERLEAAREVALDLLDDALQRRAKLDGQELRVMAARGLVAAGVESAADIDAVTRSFRERAVRQHGRETALVWGDDAPVRGKARVGVTTELHEAEERELMALARVAAADEAGALAPRAIRSAVTAREALPVGEGGLRFDTDHGRAMREAMDALGTGGRLAVLIGAAGAGKSGILAPLADAWRAEGRRVYGAAPAWRQTDDLAGAGIAGRDRAAMDAFIKRVERGALTPDADSVVVVDEVGLLSTRQALGLLRLQARYGFRLVMVGDPKQGQAIEAGGVIPLLRRALGADAVPEITGTIRQQTERERAIAGLFRGTELSGATAEEQRRHHLAGVTRALDMKREDGTVLLVPGGYRDAVRRTAALWRERMEAHADNPQARITVSAPTNADARAIGAAIRDEMRAMGRLGPDAAAVKATDQNGMTYDLALAVGDKVRLFDRTHARFADKGTHGQIGNNGSVLTVAAVRADGLVLRTEAGREGEVRWDALRDKSNGRIRLNYGTVLTVDASQGLTSTEHIDAMPGGSTPVQGFKAYVAESRHRLRSWMVVSDGAERREVSARRPLNDARPIGEADVLGNLARNLARQPEKASALAFLDAASRVRRGAVRAMQEGLQRIEARAAEGRSSVAAATLKPQAARVVARAVSRQEKALHVRTKAERLREAAREAVERIGPKVLAALAQARGMVEPRRAERKRTGARL